MNLVHVTFIVHHSKNIYLLKLRKAKHDITLDSLFHRYFFLVKTIRIVHRKQLLVQCNIFSGFQAVGIQL